MTDTLTAPLKQEPENAQSSPARASHGRSALEPFSLESLVRFGAVAFQFGLIVLLAREFDLQNKQFRYLLAYAWCAFVAQHFLVPARYALAYFVGVSVLAIGWILGPVTAAWLFGSGLLLLGLAHLPASMKVRVAALVLAAGVLAYFRADPTRWPAMGPVWPILGSMFMFRMIIYLYDMKHRAAPTSFGWSVAYFFMLPNVLFPLFPVVDYKTFARSHLSGDTWECYQKGNTWMMRGVVHLLIYRLIYQNFMLGASEVTTAGDAAVFMLTTFLRYLQVSGGFHLVIGLMCMFGFNLPATFNRWLLASSFTDFWRRINIYWKDFMQKIFFNPAFFTLKGRTGDKAALFLATGFTFFITWALHGYQTFWVFGEFQNKPQDALFWGFLGVMILANMYVENKFGRKRTLSRKARSLRDDLSVAAKTMAMFTVVVTAWTLWSAGSVGEWLTVLSRYRLITGGEAVLIGAALMSLGAAAIVNARLEQRRPKLRKAGAVIGFPIRPAVATTAAALAILAIGEWPTMLAFSDKAAAMADNLRVHRLNSRDEQMLERGYYESLLDIGRLNPELAEIYADRPIDWNENPTIRRNEGAYPPYDLHPSMKVEYKGAMLSTNQWGMRDRAYTKTRPPNTFRIAILGSSHVVGVGIRDNETFENVVEDRLNAMSDEYGCAFEILNFAVSGYGPLCRLATLEQRVFPFDPDLVISVGIDDVNWIANEVSHAASKELNIPYEPIRRTMAESGITPGMGKVVAEQKFMPDRETSLAWAYGRVREICESHGVALVATYIPRPEDKSDEKDILERQAQIAREAGIRVLDTTGAFSDVEDLESLWIARWDRHPGARGHRLLADAVFEALRPVLDGLVEQARNNGRLAPLSGGE